MFLLILLKIKLYTPPHTRATTTEVYVAKYTLPPKITEVKRVPIPTPAPITIIKSIVYRPKVIRSLICKFLFSSLLIYFNSVIYYLALRFFTSSNAFSKSGSFPTSSHNSL